MLGSSVQCMAQWRWKQKGHSLSDDEVEGRGHVDHGNQEVGQRHVVRETVPTPSPRIQPAFGEYSIEQQRLLHPALFRIRASIINNHYYH